MLFSYLFVWIIAAIIVIIFLIDWIPQLNSWQSRIHIGRYVSQKVWHNRLLEKSLQWLHKTPNVKVTDNNRLIVIDMLKGNYKRQAIQSWQQAALLLGLNEYAVQTKEATVSKSIYDFVQKQFDVTGNWKTNPTEVDDIILAYAILRVENLDLLKYKPAFDFCYDLILQLKGADGTIAYRKHNPDYRYVDTIGFICPFLINYGLKFQIDEAVTLGIKQITEFNKYGMLHDLCLPCHTYLITTKLPVGLFGWGRGLGWYAIGLIDSWTALPDEHQYKNELKESVIAFAKMAIKFQNENGSWNWLVSSKGARADSSTTATLAWFFANASQIESIREIGAEAKSKALHYLMSVTRRDGAVDFSQGDTKGIGVHSQHFDILPFAQGFCLRTLMFYIGAI